MNSASTSEWWISVVFVGLFINLLSNFISTFIQRNYSHLNRKWSERTEKLANFRATRIKSLANSDHELYLAFLNLNQMRLDSIFEYILAILILGFAAATKEFSPGIYTLGVIAAMLSALQGALSTLRHGQESLLLLEAKTLNNKWKNEGQK